MKQRLLWLLGIILCAIALFLLFCGSAHGQNIGIDFDCKDYSPDKNSFQVAYDRAMEELSPKMYPHILIIHCGAESNRNSTRVSWGLEKWEIWLYRDDFWQFTRSISLLVFLRKSSSKVNSLARKIEKSGVKSKPKEVKHENR